MTGENTEGQQQPNPLAAERERLRQAGYTEAEISQILIARATGGGAPRDALPQGVLSNALGSIAAVGAYAAGLFTSIPHDLATMLDPSSKASARSGAFVSLLFKAVVIGVLGFAAWQEWQQHVVSQTEIAEAQARKIEIEAENAKALNEAQVKKLEAEAAVAKELNDAQTRKVRAEECSARMKAVIDTVPVSDWPAANDAIQKDCDPAYAEREKACADKFKALIASLETLDLNDKNPGDTMLKKANEYKAQCPFGLDEQAATKAALARRQAELDKLKDIVEAAKQKAQAQRSPDAPPVPAQETTAQPVAPDLPTPAPAPASPSPPVPAPQVASAPAQPDPSPTLRTPSGFHCNKASMSMGSDWVICSSPQLMDAEARLEEAYAATRAYRGKSVGSEQVEWIKHFPTNCGLPYRGRPSDEQIQSAAGCIGEAMEKRIKELQAE